ncbi:MAG: cobalamin-dependent protein [Verrucomicrobia bacterium]|nr:cobalamin-dependent protein [Verrucomicrobiota bacterium]MDA1065743.1 cobalamin-dependent protein [Verrucomicrobiota bacterium]
MKKTVTIVEIGIYDEMLPLVSGYLECYASKNPEVKARYCFDYYTSHVNANLDNIINDLLQKSSDVFALSCYIWNMVAMLEIKEKLVSRHPNATIVLGGPQVMNYANEYLNPNHERSVVCNGEGERVFANLLMELLSVKPDFSNVRGISFFKDNELIKNPPEERISDLNEIPSPFLNGVFDDKRGKLAIYETNRGCPYKCTYCFWGAATNDSVYRFDEDRVRDEITWLSQHGVPLLYIADANWGLIKRDIGLSQHIADCKEKYNMPIYVYFSSAKNSPSRVSEITRIFAEAKVMNHQPVSMQSLNPRTLELVQRSNIKLSAYGELQDDLNARKIDSYIELIWPLPGETLESFKGGVQDLIERKASVIETYAHILLHNTPMSKNREAFGLVTKSIKNDTTEIVVGTADLSHEDFQEGIWFYYAVVALFNTRSIHLLTYYLRRHEIMGSAELYSRFMRYCREEHPEHFFTSYCRETIRSSQYYDIHIYPMVYLMSLETKREEFSQLLYDFASSQPWWGDPNARVMFEADMLNRIYLFSNSDFLAPTTPFEFFRVLSTDNRTYSVDIPSSHISILNEIGRDLKRDTLNSGNGHRCAYTINHNQEQLPVNMKMDEAYLANHCYGAIMRGAKHLPSWEAAKGPVQVFMS